MAGASIRLGNVMNSEIIGKPTDLPWAFIFARVDKIPRHPTQLYESLAYLLIFFLMLYLYHRFLYKNRIIPPGYFVGLFLILVFTVRFFIEFLKEPQVKLVESLNMGQLLSIPFIIFGLWLVLRKHKTVANKIQSSPWYSILLIQLQGITRYGQERHHQSSKRMYNRERRFSETISVWVRIQERT